MKTKAAKTEAVKAVTNAENTENKAVEAVHEYKIGDRVEFQDKKNSKYHSFVHNGYNHIVKEGVIFAKYKV